ncbi:MAG: hypothetical protein GOMPHAMPRED_003708 [Gomphillus americanus]|uniref:Galactose oxidase n=1 Tax=Gomphillus americanus TaxID=1940652 RepID=A0A8H3FPD9_9LECA|nr:MAG: hypothetical protein GOMPHAMPRED_003708 [Gomphillus americanus]
MEGGAIAAAYTAETVAEGAVVGTVAMAQSTLPISAIWTKVSPVELPRSSHSVCVITGRAYIFGGEIEPRNPVDNDMHVVTLPSGTAEGDYRKIVARGDSVPDSRVGHTGVSIGNKVYIFGGRGGPNMKALEEKGRVWCFDTISNEWSALDPADGSQYPEARSFHSSTATEHPLPRATEYGTKLEDHYGTILIHGGCLAQGRTADIWSFDVKARFWSKLPDAPGPARGGTALAISRSRLYRFGGFDGEKEIGGQIDFIDLAKDVFDDKGGRGEYSVTLKSGKWDSISIPPGHGPEPRSVAGLHPITTGQGRNYLVLVLGEKTPSSSGHESAGEFFDDVWAFQVRPDGNTGASWKDAVRMLVGAKSSEDTWAQVKIPEASMEQGLHPSPGPRGWIASAGCGDVDAESILVWGGINGDNKRLADGWMLTFNPE